MGYFYTHYRMDQRGFERCFELLAGAGLPFTEERRESFPWLKDAPPIIDIYGHLTSSKGPVSCRFRNSMGRYFDLRVPFLDEDQWDVTEALERALADYILKEPDTNAEQPYGLSDLNKNNADGPDVVD